MPVMTESIHTGEFIVSEGNNNISRELIKLAPDLTLLPGTVLGKTQPQQSTVHLIRQPIPVCK